MVKCITGIELEGDREFEHELDPMGWRLARGLDVVGACLDRRARAVEGYTALLHLLTTPRGGQRLREAARLLWVVRNACWTWATAPPPCRDWPGAAGWGAPGAAAGPHGRHGGARAVNVAKTIPSMSCWYLLHYVK